VYRTIGRSVVTVEERKDLTAWFVGAAFAFTLVGAALAMAWFARLP